MSTALGCMYLVVYSVLFKFGALRNNNNTIIINIMVVVALLVCIENNRRRLAGRGNNVNI